MGGGMCICVYVKSNKKNDFFSRLKKSIREGTKLSMNPPTIEPTVTSRNVSRLTIGRRLFEAEEEWDEEDQEIHDQIEEFLMEMGTYDIEVVSDDE